MNKEEIIKQLDKQNIELSEELSITKDKLNKSEYLLELKQQELDKYKNIVDELEKWLKANNEHFTEALPFRETLRKLKELKGE